MTRIERIGKFICIVKIPQKLKFTLISFSRCSFSHPRSWPGWCSGSAQCVTGYGRSDDRQTCSWSHPGDDSRWKDCWPCDPHRRSTRNGQNSHCNGYVPFLFYLKRVPRLNDLIIFIFSGMAQALCIVINQTFTHKCPLLPTHSHDSDCEMLYM